MRGINRDEMRLRRREDFPGNQDGGASNMHGLGAGS